MAEIDLSTLPVPMQSLPRDERGFPIPWFVAWVNGKPEFRAMDSEKLERALSERRCWVCGEKRGVYCTFVVGPMCGINRIASEPPSHEECARWSAVNCPFLNNPRTIRREDDVINNANLAAVSAGVALSRNPGVVLLWKTRSFEILPDGKGILLIMGKPEQISWYANGRQASRTEVIESIKTGLAPLVEMARKNNELKALKAACDEFECHLPSNQFTNFKADLPLMVL